jgi:hypothetical protein
MDRILQTALEEERQLVARLSAVRALIRAYGGATENQEEAIAPTQDNLRRTRSPSEHTQSIKALVRDLIRSKKEPTATRDILSSLEGAGIQVHGKNPVATLSALLSHAEEFEPVGRKGWLLKSRTPDADTSGTASTDEARSSSIESQQEEPSVG